MSGMNVKRKIPIDRDAMVLVDDKGVKHGYHMRDALAKRRRTLNQLIKRHSLLTVRRMLQARLNISRKRIDPSYASNAQSDLDWMKAKAMKGEKNATSYGKRSKPKSKSSSSQTRTHALSIRCLVKTIGKQKTLALLRACYRKHPKKFEREMDYVFAMKI